MGATVGYLHWPGTRLCLVSCLLSRVAHPGHCPARSRGGRPGPRLGSGNARPPSAASSVVSNPIVGK
jgi:hypothetical protein